MNVRLHSNVCKLCIGKYWIVHLLYNGNLLQLVNTQSQQIKLYSTHKNWTSGQGINVLIKRTIIMTQGASKVTSTHKNLIKRVNRFFSEHCQKIVPTI